MIKKKNGLMDKSTQVMIPILTIVAQLLIAFKYPGWGMIISMAAQPFWFYSSWKAYKEAGQSGLLITTSIMTFVFGYGILNYWVIG